MTETYLGDTLSELLGEPVVVHAPVGENGAVYMLGQNCRYFVVHVGTNGEAEQFPVTNYSEALDQFLVMRVALTCNPDLVKAFRHACDAAEMAHAAMAKKTAFA